MESSYQSNKEDLDGRSVKYNKDHAGQEDEENLDRASITVAVLEPGADEDTTESQ